MGRQAKHRRRFSKLLSFFALKGRHCRSDEQSAALPEAWRILFVRTALLMQLTEWGLQESHLAAVIIFCVRWFKLHLEPK
ncbi:hypothetical protein Y032_0097g2998 [Ancylostoma ceylanicum]|nr:hypothetical protein Y032_0097g2998 [Ancylostoma ceylanicum]